MLLISAFCRAASVTLVLTLKLDFTFDMVLDTGFICSEIIGGAVHVLEVGGGPLGGGAGAAGGSDGARGEGCILCDPAMLGL